ncbi:MAG: protein kinase domain-containing protein [Kofleriaceae bacterium]
MAERQFGPYRLVRQIAVGGMAEIHLAKTKGIAGFEKYVALKMIHPNFAEDEAFIQMLVDEAKIAVQLAHGNIAQTFDLGRVGDTYYITMEYVDGADLYKILRKGSEMDLEMPLDCCAFIAKEIASALDHAHRKKDHVGKPLGIVHRDVSPQNVLVSYSGEVKLVDFGIAKATMKARQTAVGVIKGKYYYMSPEQAWGDPIDFRSDIFSAGIVLYEMMTGQMLYLEEDLHRLLDMARKADIASPSKLRKGIPPQLEKIVMHALQKVPGERYQSAADFASDLERFLHAYSPVFTAAKVSGLLRQIVGDPVAVNNEADFPDIEVHDGANATFTLDTNDLVHAGDELRDENSVIFAVDELKPSSQPKMQSRSGPAQPRKKDGVPSAPQERAPTAPTKQVVGAAKPAPRAPGNMTRAHAPTEPPPVGSDGKARPPTGNLGAVVAPIPSLKQPAPPVVAPKKKPAQPRRPTDDTRQLDYVAPATEEDSGPIEPGSAADPSTWEHGDPADDELANIGENTMITSPSQMRGFMRDAGEEIEATLVSDGPPVAPDDTSEEELDTESGEPEDDEAVEDPTIARDFRAKKPAVSKRPAQPPPPAFAAKIHAPAVSELRKPRPSKRTPQGGVPQQANVLQAIVAKQTSEPMPVPRAPLVAHHPEQQPPPPPQFPHATPGAQQAAPPFSPQVPSTGYATDASGLPLAMPTPPGLLAVPPYPQQAYPQPPYPQQPYQYPQQPQQPQQPQYPQPQYYPPGHPAYAVQPGYPQYPQQQVPGQPMTPGALYSMQPAPKPMTLTGQLRLFEVDEMPSQYQLGAARKRWFTYIVAGLIAISVAAAATFLIIRSTRETAPTVGSIRVESLPAGAEVVFDDVRLAGTTPLSIPSVPVNTRHTIKVELKRHERYTETVDVPSRGGEITIKAVLNPMTGKLIILSQPEGAEVWINGEVRGRTPTTIKSLDMQSAKKLELRLKDYQPFVQDLVWPDNGSIQIDAKLKP